MRFLFCPSLLWLSPRESVVMMILIWLPPLATLYFTQTRVNIVRKRIFWSGEIARKHPELTSIVVVNFFQKAYFYPNIPPWAWVTLRVSGINMAVCQNGLLAARLCSIVNCSSQVGGRHQSWSKPKCSQVLLQILENASGSLEASHGESRHQGLKRDTPEESSGMKPANHVIAGWRTGEQFKIIRSIYDLVLLSDLVMGPGHRHTDLLRCNNVKPFILREHSTV